MSGLDDVLAGVLAGGTAGGAAGGVHRWPTAYDVEETRHAAERAGWAFAHVDGRRIASMSQAHDALAGALRLPDHYGHNLDALHDCLSELDRPTLLLWDTWWVLARAYPRRFALLTTVLDERPDVLAVLLRGDGPDGVLPRLG